MNSGLTIKKIITYLYVCEYNTKDCEVLKIYNYLYMDIHIYHI